MDKVSIVFEDKNFVVVNKPPGLMVHPTKTSQEKTLVDFLLKEYPEVSGVGDNPSERPGIVHRLDKDTSGVLVVARTQSFFEYIKKLFSAGGGSALSGQSPSIKKMYIALVFGETPESGVIDMPVGLKSGTTKRSVNAKRMKMIKEAVTEYKTLKTFSYKGGDFSLIELYPRTGRTHQLRVHLASIHHPVVGDQLYGKRKNPWGLARQFLHAESIEFSMPDGKRIRAEADMPEDLRSILDSF